MKKWPWALMGLGGAALAGGAWYLSRKATSTEDSITDALNATYTPGAAGAKGKAPTVNLRLTGYWPFTARADEKKMEGGTKDRKGAPLHTLEDFLAGRADFVSLSGDDALWPYGQKVLIPWKTTQAGDIMVTGRVVDTGGNFRGAGKVYRVTGYEPIDVCVQSSKTEVPKLVTAEIIPGDNFAKGAAVATSGFKNQTVAGLVEARTAADHVLLGCALSSGRLSEEQMTGLGWTVRNRADLMGVSVEDLLRQGYVSTQADPVARAQEIADQVLGADGEDDPTEGAIDYWSPPVQARLHLLGQIHRLAGDASDEVAEKYARFANYGSVDEVRQRHAEAGLEPSLVCGALEFLRLA